MGVHTRSSRESTPKGPRTRCAASFCAFLRGEQGELEEKINGGGSGRARNRPTLTRCTRIMPALFFANEKIAKTHCQNGKKMHDQKSTAQSWPWMRNFARNNVHVRGMPAIYARAPFMSKSNMDPARKNKAILFPSVGNSSFLQFCVCGSVACGPGVCH